MNKQSQYQVCELTNITQINSSIEFIELQIQSSKFIVHLHSVQRKGTNLVHRHGNHTNHKRKPNPISPQLITITQRRCLTTKEPNTDSGSRPAKISTLQVVTLRSRKPQMNKTTLPMFHSKQLSVQALKPSGGSTYEENNNTILVPMKRNTGELEIEGTNKIQ